MNDNIKAGSDIHAGDGGYSEGTQEKYDEFVKGRNQSLSKNRIRELAEQATSHMPGQHPYDGLTFDMFDKEKFAELLIKECIRVIEESEGYSQYFPHVTGNIEKHFGVKL